MAITFDEVEPLKKELEQDNLNRHQAHRKLRDFWHGRYWKDIDSQTHGISSIFRDVTTKRSDVGPDIKLVRNLLFDVHVKYMTFLSPLPMIRTFVDQPDSRRGRAQATLKERVLYGLWAEGDMNQVLNRAAWYLPLMGDCFLGIWPDFDRNIVKPIIRSPEYAYPVMGAEDKAEAFIFAWKWPRERAKRAFPSWTPTDALLGNQTGWFGRKNAESDKYVEVVEYTDSKEFARFVDGQKVNGIEHDLGFNLFDQLSFIYVPDEPWNHGAVEQAVNMVEAGNALYSLLMQAMLENVFPRLILENPMAFPEQIDTGAGAVIGVNQGGKAYFLEPPPAALGAGMAFLANNEQAIQKNSGVNDATFGRFDASIITGKAINELQGAGTGSTVEMVQGVGIGNGLVKWNEHALYMLKTMFAEDTIYLHGIKPRSFADLKPTQFGLKFKGAQIVGSQRNEVVFSPYLNEHEKLVMGLQGLGAGIFSKGYVMEQVGVADVDAMTEEIFNEAVDQGILGALVQAFTQEPSPEAGQKAEEQAAAYLGDLPGAVPPPHPVLALGAGMPPAGQPPPGQAPPGPPQGPPGQGAPPGAPPGQQQGPQVVDLPSVISAVQQVQGIQGRVFLVGELVVRGQTANDIEIALTNGADRQTLTAGLPQYTGRLVFHPVNGEPSERYVEVTPGSPARPGGAAQQTPEALSGVFVQ